MSDQRPTEYVGAPEVAGRLIADRVLADPRAKSTRDELRILALRVVQLEQDHSLLASVLGEIVCLTETPIDFDLVWQHVLPTLAKPCTQRSDDENRFVYQSLATGLKALDRGENLLAIENLLARLLMIARHAEYAAVGNHEIQRKMDDAKRTKRELIDADRTNASNEKGKK